jgi:hypothetical protein
MLRRALYALALAGVASAGLLPVRGASAASGIEEDYASFDGRVTDVKGVVTEVAGFGFSMGANVLTVHPGAGELDIPLRIIRSVEIGTFVAERRRAPATVTLRTGKSIQVELDESEEDRLMLGDTEFGVFRIRLGKVRRLDVGMVDLPPAG